LGPLGRWPAWVEEIRRGPAAGPAGDGRGAVQGLLGADFGKLDWAERRPATAVGGAPGWRPRWCVLRRGGGSVRGGSEPASYE
jgi:hypothetical protein